jgi:hypothetical protein
MGLENPWGDSPNLETGEVAQKPASDNTAPTGVMSKVAPLLKAAMIYGITKGMGGRQSVAGIGAGLGALQGMSGMGGLAGKIGQTVNQTLGSITPPQYTKPTTPGAGAGATASATPGMNPASWLAATQPTPAIPTNIPFQALPTMMNPPPQVSAARGMGIPSMPKMAIPRLPKMGGMAMPRLSRAAISPLRGIQPMRMSPGMSGSVRGLHMAEGGPTPPKGKKGLSILIAVGHAKPPQKGQDMKKEEQNKGGKICKAAGGALRQAMSERMGGPKGPKGISENPLQGVKAPGKKAPASFAKGGKVKGAGIAIRGVRPAKIC